jgi:hypothetical protein
MVSIILFDMHLQNLLDHANLILLTHLYQHTKESCKFLVALSLLCLDTHNLTCI